MKKLSVIILSTVVSVFLLTTSWAKEPYKVGAMFSITGPASWLGEPERNTARMIEEQINKQGGINGHPLQIIVEDTAGDEGKSVLAIRKLITRDKVCAVIGPSRSGSTMAVIPIAEQYGVPLISCAAAEAIIQPVKKWVFKTPQSDADAVIRIYDKAKEMDVSKIALMSATTGFGTAGREQLIKLAGEMGLTIVADETYNPRDTDMTAQLTKIMGTDAQAVVNWSIVPAQTTVMRNRKQLGMKIPLFQSHGFGNIEYAKAAGDAAEGVLFPGSRLLIADLLSDDDPQKEILVKYKNDYESKFNTDVSAFGGYAYDALYLVIDALKEVGADRAKIRDHIENRKGFLGITGIFNYAPDDHYGLDKTAFEMIGIKDGRFVPAE